ncbi:hypothetical protein ACZ90_01690 [Streptomyces albus subsp. albus]|nr:hypothetical protein ACZ90_01690 [Streptomyces albus subsp. albus]
MEDARGGGAVVYDRQWPGELRTAVWATVALLAVMVLVDLGNGTLTPVRALVWIGVAVLFFGVLCPPRVSAGDGWLAVRGVFGRRTEVRTDLLTAVARLDGMAPRLSLRDVLGRRAEIDPKVLTANPLLWHRLDAGVRVSRARGLLRTGEAPLRALADRIDGDGARRLLDSAKLHDPDGPREP